MKSLKGLQTKRRYSESLGVGLFKEETAANGEISVVWKNTSTFLSPSFQVKFSKI